jgi:hypothetical protein
MHIPTDLGKHRGTMRRYILRTVQQGYIFKPRVPLLPTFDAFMFTSSLVRKLTNVAHARLYVRRPLKIAC